MVKEAMETQTEDGYFVPTDKPGLGVTLNHERVAPLLAVHLS